MLEFLDIHAQMNYSYLITGDESWMMSDQMLSKMKAPDRDHVDTIVQSSHKSRKTMVAVIFGVNGIGFVKILPKDTKLISEYFKDQVLREICQGLHGS
jgi:hypothetical protein